MRRTRSSRAVSEAKRRVVVSRRLAGSRHRAAGRRFVLADRARGARPAHALRHRHEHRPHLGEVGQQFSVTRERIRQIEAKALRKLKHPSRSRKLRSFLDT